MLGSVFPFCSKEEITINNNNWHLVSSFTFRALSLIFHPVRSYHYPPTPRPSPLPPPPPSDIWSLSVLQQLLCDVTVKTLHGKCAAVLLFPSISSSTQWKFTILLLVLVVVSSRFALQENINQEKIRNFFLVYSDIRAINVSIVQNLFRICISFIPNCGKTRAFQ